MKVVGNREDAFLGLSEDQIASTQEFIDRLEPSQLEDWAASHTVVRHMNEQPYEMLVDQGESGHTIVIGGEYANGLKSLGALARAQTIRDLVDPDATLILQPNSTRERAHMNFSHNERKILAKGYDWPIVMRIVQAIESVGPSELTKVTTFGPSQAGAVMLKAARYVPGNAHAIIEAPNVIASSRAGLMTRFGSSGKQLADVVAANFTEPTELSRQLAADLSALPMARFALRDCTHPDNRALLWLLAENSLGADMISALRNGGSVVHAWATGDKVSPAEENRDLVPAMISYEPAYQAFELSDRDHSVTNDYLLSAALVHRARLNRGAAGAQS